MTQSRKEPFAGLGPALRLLRKRHGLTQQQIADRAGITKAMMSAYEVGKYFPALETLSRLLVSLDCDLRRLQDAMEEAAAGDAASSAAPAESLER
jgi:transcriptional regulator with XRE-family HTH domain